MPESVVYAASINRFKNRFDKHYINMKFSSTLSICIMIFM